MNYRYNCRIYYEDTDAGGVVYYANYLKFAERARTEWLRELGYSQNNLRNVSGIIFVVRRVEVDYLRPARLDDEIVIESQLHEFTRTSITMHQRILKGDETLSKIAVKLVGVDDNIKPCAIPRQIIDSLQTKYSHSD